jgi:hypothetical protein
MNSAQILRLGRFALVLFLPATQVISEEDGGKEVMNKIAVFSVDVTPPIGHPLCAGWYPPATGVTDRLTAKGILLTGKEKPVVLVALDWAEISNYEHLRWRQAIAEAVGTDPERVGVHCTHAHNSPWPDREAQTVLDELGFPDLIMTGTFCEEARRRVAAAARAAQAELKPCTDISTGQAVVKEVASNRRILGADGKVKAVRWTKTKDPAVRAEPEGVIDPVLRTLIFWNGSEKLATLHFYAVHPTSFDGDGLVTPDFTGLAREQRQAEDGGVPHLYFTGCAGNITAGKYNDGDPAHRPALTRRVYEAMAESEKSARRRPLGDWGWSVQAVHLPPREDLREADLIAAIRNPETIREEKSRAALIISYLRRADLPVQVGCLRLGPNAFVLSLPGETFIEYQLGAQARRPGDWVATVSYGDLGPGYIPLAVSYAQGGYEPKDAFVSGGAEPILRRAIETVLRAAPGPAR